MESTFINSLPIDNVMIALVLLSGFLQKRLVKICPCKFSGAWKTLILSLALNAIYAGTYYFQHDSIKDMLIKWFFSYVLATSLYELLMKRILKKFLAANEEPVI